MSENTPLWVLLLVQPVACNGRARTAERKSVLRILLSCLLLIELLSVPENQTDGNQCAANLEQVCQELFKEKQVVTVYLSNDRD